MSSPTSGEAGTFPLGIEDSSAFPQEKKSFERHFFHFPGFCILNKDGEIGKI